MRQDGGDSEGRTVTYHVKDVVQPRNPLTLGLWDTGDGVNLWLIDGDTGDTDPLLHDLKPNDKLDATPGVELARADAEKHVEIRVALRRLSLQLGDVADVLELGFGLAHVLAGLTTEPAEDIASLFLAADLGEPTWGLGEEPDDGEEEDERDDLESDGEAPDERGGPISVERTGAVTDQLRDGPSGGVGRTYYSNQ